VLAAVAEVLQLITSVPALRYLADRLQEQVEATSTTSGMEPTTTLDPVKEQEVRAAVPVGLGSLEDERHLTKV
jgi:hypothetical protein